MTADIRRSGSAEAVGHLLEVLGVGQRIKVVTGFLLLMRVGGWP